LNKNNFIYKMIKASQKEGRQFLGKILRGKSKEKIN